MGGRGSGSSTFSATPTTAEGYGKSSLNGEMKTVRLYHASFSDFEEFDYSKKQKRGSDLQGEGFYFTSDPKQARLFGNILYEVEVKYSTDRRTAKRTGREKDFQYDPKTGYWVIPANKSKNIKIIRKRRIV